MAGLFNGHLLEFPQIRVDSFGSPPSDPAKAWRLPHPSGPELPFVPAPPAQLYLLTHVHSDHIVGLTDTFTGHIVCSPDTKRMLLKLEYEKTRKQIENGDREVASRKFEGLRRRVVDAGTKDERVIDRIEAVPYGCPKVFQIGYEDNHPINVTITLLDANHCPGSTMFLVTSDKHAVLHTGDVRADTTFMLNLRRHPALSEFVRPRHLPVKLENSSSCATKTLDRIYLDTSAFLGTGDMPGKESVLCDLVDQTSLYPDDTIFFLNVWCFGWEDVVKEIARSFGTKVYVDRYKHSIYASVKSDPFLLACTTDDPYSTRFHACERYARCEACRIFNKQGQKVYNLDKRIVSVHMVEIKSAEYEQARVVFLERLGQAAIGEGPWPFTIDCPLARHSPLPELQALVKLLKPKALSPNTMVPEAMGLDYYLLPELFQDCLTDHARTQLSRERDAWFGSSPRFGPAWLRNISTMQAGAGDLLSDLPKRADLGLAHLPRPHFGESSSGFGRKRKDHILDQIGRAGGMLQISASELPAFMQSLGGTGRIITVPGTADGQTPFSALGKHLAGGLRLDSHTGQPLGQNDDYDTDDEKQRIRKRVRSGATCAPVRTVKTERAPTPYKEEWKPAAVGKHTHSPSLDVIDTPIVVKAEPQGPSPADAPRRKFIVDRAHLRALADVAAEVDDL